MSLVTGSPPASLVDEKAPVTWNALDLEVLAQWKSLKDTKCPGCGRPLSQHLKNEFLEREENPEDYVAYSVECPAQQAIAEGQNSWRIQNKSSIERYQAGKGSDPTLGLYWISQGPGESVPKPE